MLSLTAGFTTEKNKKTGAAPIWLLKIPFVAGTMWLSDRVPAKQISLFPPAQNSTYVKATSEYPAGDSFRAYLATDPTKRLTGDQTDNQWTSNAATNQRFHIDLGAAKIVDKIYYENGHISGTNTNIGVKNFTLWGSNNAAAFADLTYADDTNWTQIGGALQMDQHVASDAADPKYITVANSTPYRYYALKIADTWGGANISLRRIELQEAILPLIASWGQIDEDISNQLSMPQVSDFRADIIVDPDADPNIDDLLWTEAVETLDCELYLWFGGLDAATDPPKLRWTGNIIDFEKVSELVYQVNFIDGGAKLNSNPGRVLSLADYPNASLNDVGYQMSIGYGTLTRVPALRLDVSKKTTLMTDITAFASAFTLSTDISPNGLMIIIDGERIQVDSVSGKNVSACRRAQAAYAPGNFVALSTALPSGLGMAAAPNGDVYTTDATAGSAQIFKQTAGEGAFVALGTSALVWRAVCVAPNGDVYACVSGGDIYRQAGGVGSFTALSQASLAWNGMCAAPNGDIYASVYGGDIYKRAGGTGNFTALSQSSLGWMGMCATHGGDIYCIVVGGDIYKRTAGAGNFTAIGGTNRYWSCIAVAPNGDIYAGVGSTSQIGDIYVRAGGTGAFVAVGETARQYMGLAVAPDGSVYLRTYQGAIYKKQGTGAAHTIGAEVSIESGTEVALFLDHPVKSIDKIESVDQKGNITDVTALCATYTGQGGAHDLAGYAGMGVISAPVNYLITDKFLISGQGYQDDGTFGGSSGDLIERPDHIFCHFLYTYAGLPVANFSTDAATPFAADSYKFSMVLNSRKKLREWLANMALQCRCWFRFNAGLAYLLYRPDSLTSDKTIAKFADNDDNTTTMRVRRSPLDEIINKIDLLYKRDWSKPDGREAYQAVTSANDATSIAAYGEKEQPDLFLFDFVWVDAMAADLLAFYLARYKDRKKVVTGDLFLDNFEIEFADAVTLTEAGGILCEVGKAGDAPGSGRTATKLPIVAREY